MVIKDKEQGLHTNQHLSSTTRYATGNHKKCFITEFTEFLTEATPKHNNILILGDFNIHINDLKDADSCLLLDTISAFNLKQHVDIPMYNLGHTLDLIIMENSEEYQVEKIIPGPYISDHWFITMQLTECKLKVQQLLTKHRKIPDNIV